MDSVRAGRELTKIRYSECGISRRLRRSFQTWAMIPSPFKKQKSRAEVARSASIEASFYCAQDRFLRYVPTNRDCSGGPRGWFFQEPVLSLAKEEGISAFLKFIEARSLAWKIKMCYVYLV
jgi:hypothetical protein